MGSLQQKENEIAARRIFEDVTFIELKPNENGASGKVDYVALDASFDCALEVTTHTNELRTRLVNGGGTYSGIIPRRDLFDDWVIQTRDHPHLKRINDLVIPQLHTLSVHGIFEYYKSQHEWWMRRVPTLEKTLSAFNSASVEYVKRQRVIDRDEENTANVVLLPMVNWSFGGPDSALGILESDPKIFPENVGKLLESGAKSRHLFVWVDVHTDRDVLDAFNAEKLELPTRAPKLPNEITHLWIVNRQTEVGWFYEPIEGWRLIGVN